MICDGEGELLGGVGELLGGVEDGSEADEGDVVELDAEKWRDM